MKFAHTNIISINWKELADFYVKTFDCKIVPPIRKQSGEWLEKGTGLKNAKLEGAHLLLPGYGDNGPTLEIYQYENIERQDFVSPNKRGYGHIAFEVESVEKVLEILERNGGKSFGKITKRLVRDVGEITFVYARDPEGNLIELQSWKKASLQHGV
ncbi:VOC family protein [Aquimarina algiphila]|uniref:VOC family protein n=1 Tax=Aquimarina algiphila TaxID=2047982 RepID=UPI00232B5D1C|nr:VOC family protein [Aquimarina algiphila]